MKNEIKECMGNVSIDGDGATAGFVFPASFKGFEGHFPDNPIVPADLPELRAKLEELRLQPAG